MKGLKQKLQKFFKEHISPLVGIFVITAIFFYPVWASGKIPLPVDALVGAHVPWTELKWKDYPAGIPIKNQVITDSISQFFPWRSLVGDFWRAGKPPLWNPYMFSGAPLLATLHSAALYPLNFLYFLMDNINAWTGLVFLQVFLSAVFMYLFLENLGVRRIASFLGAIAFSLSGYMVGWLEFATGGQAGLWLPLLLLFENKLTKSQKRVWLLPIALIFFFIYTAGDFQVPFYIILTYLLFGAFFLFRKGVTFSSFAKSVILVLTGLVSGVLLALPQLLPTLELFTRSIRLIDPYISEHFFGIAPWKNFANFLWPDFFGNPVTRNYWGSFDYHEHSLFVGSIPLVFAIYGLISSKKKEIIFFGMLLIISLLFLFPTPIAFLPYQLKIPGFGTSSASRIIFLVDFCLATMAAFGFSNWLEKEEKTILKIVSFLLTMTLLVALVLVANIYFIPQGLANFRVALKNMVPSSAILLSFAFVLVCYFWISPKLKEELLKKFISRGVIFFILLLTIIDVLRFAWKNTSFSPREFVFPRTQIISFLEDADKPFRIAGGIPLNLFMPYKISSAEGYDPIYPERNGKWFSGVNYGSLKAASGRFGTIHYFSSPLLDYANMVYVVDYKKDSLGEISDKGNLYPGIEPPRFRPLFTEGRITVFENLDALPRVWASTNYQVISKEDEIVVALTNENSSKNKLIVLESEPPIETDEKKIHYQLKNFKQTFNKISLEIFSSKPALVFLSESYDPGWRVFIDGNEDKVLRANFIYQAVAIPSGSHELQFIYEPKSFKIGISISITTAVVLIALALYEGFIAKKL